MSSKRKQNKRFKKLILITSILFFGLAIDKMEPSYANIFENLGPQRFLKEGNKSLEKKNFNDAIKSFDDAIKFLPKNAEAYYRRGIAYYKLGFFKSSLEDFKKAISINSDYKNNGELLLYISDNYWFLEKYKDAIDAYTKLEETP